MAVTAGVEGLSGLLTRASGSAESESFGTVLLSILYAFCLHVVCVSYVLSFVSNRRLQERSVLDVKHFYHGEEEGPPSRVQLAGQQLFWILEQKRSDRSRAREWQAPWRDPDCCALVGP